MKSTLISGIKSIKVIEGLNIILGNKKIITENIF
jgi:hypothetical protein